MMIKDLVYYKLYIGKYKIYEKLYIFWYNLDVRVCLLKINAARIEIFCIFVVQFKTNKGL